MTAALRRAWVALAVLGSAFACDAENVSGDPWRIPDSPGSSSSGLPGTDPPAPPIPTPVCEPFGDLRLAMPDRGAFWRNGWEQVSPAPFRGDIMAIAGTSATDVWWSGTTDPISPTMSAIAHYDGARTTALLGVGVPTWPIAVVSPTEVWIGPHLRFVGGVLERSPSSAPGTAGLRFFASNDGWSVGAGVWHWNGAAWTLQTGAGLGPFTAVDGLGPTDVWVAGSDRISRWNGSTWSPTPQLPGGPQIRDLRVRAPNDVWAVGSGIFHYDGATWQELTSSIDSWTRTFASGSRVYFLGMGAIGQLENGVVRVADDNAEPCAGLASNFGLCGEGFLAPTGELFVATAAGTGSRLTGPWRRPAGAVTSETTTSLVSHLGTPNLRDEATFRGTTPGDLVALAEGTLYRGPVGGPWTAFSRPVLPPETTLEKLSGLSGRELWLTFHQQDDRYGAVHFDGTTFGAPTLFPEGFVPEDGPYSFGDGSAGCNGHMEGGPSSDALQTVIFDGNGWTKGTTDELVLSKENRFRLVRGGSKLVAVEHLEAGEWVRQQPLLSGTETTFFPLMATGPTDVALVSDRGTIWRWDGTQWTNVQPGRDQFALQQPAIYLGNGRIWAPSGVSGGVLEKGCRRVDPSIVQGTLVTGNAERLFAFDRLRNGQLRSRTFSF